MGASTDTRVVKGATKEEAIAAARELMESDRCENGHEYSGTIGMADGVRVEAGTWTAEKAEVVAFDFKGGRCQKYGPALLFKLEGSESKWLLCAVCAS